MALLDDALAGLGSGLKGGLVIGAITFIVLGVLIGIMVYVYYRRKFDITIEIKSDRAGGYLNTYYDKGGVLTDKDGNKYLRFLKSKVELPIPPFGLSLSKTNRGDVVRYYRKSEEEYVPLTESTINRNYVVRVDGKKHPVAEEEFQQVEGDVAFWNVKRKATHKKLFDPENMFMKILPYLPQIVGGVILIFVLYILFDSLPAILNDLRELVRELRAFRGQNVEAGFGF